MKAVNEILPYYGQSKIPAGTYAGIDYDVNTIAVNGIPVTSIDQDEQLIYEITKALWNDTTRNLLDTAGLVFCPPAEHRELMSGLAIPFSMWQCAGHGDAAGPGFVR